MVANARTTENDDGRRMQPLVLILLQLMATKQGDSWMLRCASCVDDDVSAPPLMRTEFLHLIGDAYEAGWRVLPCGTTNGRMLVACCPKHAKPLIAKYQTQAALLEAAQVAYAIQTTGEEP